MMIIATLLMLVGCNLISPENDPITYGETYVPHLLSTDKACYAPGEAVSFSVNALPEGKATIRYQHLGKTISEQTLSSLTWTWQPPTEDYQGYMAELHGVSDGKDTIYSTIGIDVSSNPARFPRNGFLSSYGNMSKKDIETVMNDLNRYHINYVQFQDWHWKHHHPLGGSATQPMDVWTDIISRNCYRSTVQGYIDEAHKRGMLTLYYNLLYGVLEDYESDGVSSEWLVYTDKQHRNPDKHPLGSPFKSAIYIANPHNADWCNYISARNDEVFAVFNFDGWQIDQLGGRGTIYDYNGAKVDLPSAFGNFINKMKTDQPTKRLVMNAVGQYGQKGQIASSPVDFCYTEVWSHSDSKGYSIFSDIITKNYDWSNGKQTVLAAYLNYQYGRKGRGWFNTPGIIMGTAAAMVWGGTILQMGEHMLCNEYFPNDNLSMSGELKRAMIAYYDFTVAYENLLREGDNSTWFGVDATSSKAIFNQWPPVKNQIATVGRHVGERDAIHMLSYRNATHLDWCDTNGDQGEPDLINDMDVTISLSRQPVRVWFASPDYLQGAAIEMDFDYANGKLSLILPALKYHSMIVCEY